MISDQIGDGGVRMKKTMRFEEAKQQVSSRSGVPVSEPKEETYGTGRFLWEMVKVLFLVFLVIIPIHAFLFQPFFVQGPSMEPNFEDGEYLVVGEFGYKQTAVGVGGWNLFTVHPFRDLARGDVVVFHPPQSAEQYYIKRVIGLPGETVEIRNGRVIITSREYPEGRILDEGVYLRPGVLTKGNEKLTLDDDEYFVLGDNRELSQDSRYFGPVKKDHITGKVLLRAWPVARAGIF